MNDVDCSFGPVGYQKNLSFVICYLSFTITSVRLLVEPFQLIRNLRFRRHACNLGEHQ